jgi:hypothetical protein
MSIECRFGYSGTRICTALIRDFNVPGSALGSRDSLWTREVSLVQGEFSLVPREVSLVQGEFSLVPRELSLM